MTEMGEPGGGGAGGSGKKPKAWGIRIASLRFTSDHGIMVDNSADWTKAGSAFPEPEWQREPRTVLPISHTRKQRVKAEAAFEIPRKDAETKSGTARGDSPAKSLSFKADASASFGPGAPVKVAVTALEDLPDMVGKLSVSARWIIKAGGKEHFAGFSGAHVVYVTYGDPVVGGFVEDGVTLRRMKKATEWVGAAWSSGKKKPVDIIEALFGRFSGYILSFDMLPKSQQTYLLSHPAVWARLQADGFAAYMNDGKGGAWPLAENVAFGGECQAIARLIRSIAHQVGLPGTFEVMYVNNMPGDPYAARISAIGTRCMGPDPTLRYALVDAPVVAGQLYDRDSGVGFNNFEAYLKYTDGGKVTWFGGGIGRMPDGADLLKVFWGLAAYQGVPSARHPGDVARKIVKVWKY